VCRPRQNILKQFQIDQGMMDHFSVDYAPSPQTELARLGRFQQILAFEDNNRFDLWIDMKWSHVKSIHNFLTNFVFLQCGSRL